MVEKPGQKEKESEFKDPLKNREKIG